MRLNSSVSQQNHRSKNKHLKKSPPLSLWRQASPQQHNCSTKRPRSCSTNANLQKTATTPFCTMHWPCCPTTKSPFRPFNTVSMPFAIGLASPRIKKATTSPQNNGPNTSRNISSPTTIPIRCCSPKPMNSITNAAMQL